MESKYRLLDLLHDKINSRIQPMRVCRANALKDSFVIMMKVPLFDRRVPARDCAERFICLYINQGKESVCYEDHPLRGYSFEF